MKLTYDGTPWSKELEREDAERIAQDLYASGVKRVEVDGRRVTPCPDTFMRDLKACATIYDTTEMQSKQHRRRKKSRAIVAIEKLDLVQVEVLLDLLNGDAAMVTVRGETYALKRVGEAWSVRGVDSGAVEHTVLGGACSCEDCKFRGNRCKHLQAIEVLEVKP